MAGVIGRRKFAYDAWGDTVNLASRLQVAAPPGGILVSEGVVQRAGERFAFGPPTTIELKGKGRQAVRLLSGLAGQADGTGDRHATVPEPA